MKLLSSFSFKLIFSETYAHYSSSFIKNVNPYTSYLFIYLYIQKHSSVGFILQNLRKTAAADSLLLKLQTPAFLHCCKFCEIKNAYLVEQLRTAASEHRIYFFFFVLILQQNRYLPLNSDHLPDKQRTVLRYGSQPSKISYLRFGNAFENVFNYGESSPLGHCRHLFVS